MHKIPLTILCRCRFNICSDAAKTISMDVTMESINESNDADEDDDETAEQDVSFLPMIVVG